MSFSPDNPDWESRGSKKNPADSLRDLFASDRVEFEPIDDDEEVTSPVVTPNLDSPAEEPPSNKSLRKEPADRPARSGRERAPKSDRATSTRKETGRREPVAAANAPQEEKPAVEEPKKKSMSYWDMLASTLGLGPSRKSDKGTPAEKAPPSRPAPPRASAVPPKSPEPAPKKPVLAIDDEKESDDESPLRDLFISSGAPVEETQRIVDDVSLDEGEDFIEFEVEDLVPGQVKRERDRDRSDASSSRSGRQRPDKQRSEKQRSDRRDERRPPRKERTPQPAAEDAVEVEAVPGNDAETETRSRRPRDRGRDRSSKPREAEGEKARERNSERSSSRERGERERDDRTPRGEREPLPSRAEGKKPPQRTRPAPEPLDEEDDFVEIQDSSTNDEKNITTWRQAVSVIVDANIQSRDRSKSSGGNRGRGDRDRGRNDRDRRR